MTIANKVEHCLKIGWKKYHIVFYIFHKLNKIFKVYDFLKKFLLL